MSQPYLSIFEAANACRQRLHQSMNLLDFPALAQDDWARKRLADFNLWASSSGAVAKQRSLDERLASQPQAKTVVINLLCLLEIFLEQCQSTARVSERNNPGVFENAAGIDELSSAKLSKEIDGVEVMINQLVRISIAIHRSGARARLERADQSFQANRHSELRDHLALLISANTLTQEEKEAGNSSLDLDSKSLTDIQLRLIDANLRRRHRFLYAQRRLRKQEEDDARQHVEPRQKQAQTALANKASHEHPSPNSREEGKPGALSKSEKDRSAPLTETNSALTALDGPIEMPMDGQLSTMVPSSTSAKVVYPQISKNPGAELFTCPCCCQSLPIYISSGPKWRRHLSEDISPYTCVLPDCSRPQQLYSSRKDWMDHMHNDHESSTYWLCFACPDPSKFTEKEKFVRHLENKHSDTVSTDQIPLFVSDCACTAPLEIPSCSLCPPLSSGDDTLEPGAVLEEIAKHIHSFSLSSLPWPIPSEKEKEYLGWAENNELVYFDINSNQGSLDKTESSSSSESERELETEGLPRTEFEDPAQDRQSNESMQGSEGQWDEVHATNTTRKNQPKPENDSTLQSFIEKYKLEERTGVRNQKEPLGIRKEPVDTSASRNRGDVIIVAVDFGMSFSSIAVAHSRTPENQMIVLSWDGGFPKSEKVPTILKYDNDGTTGPFKWGFQVPENEKKHEWFKLGLSPELEAFQSGLFAKYPSPTAAPRLSGDICEKLVVDYLWSLRIHTDNYLKDHFGSLVLDVTPREYIITVPAIWSDRAQYRTRLCAHKAGMGDREKIQVISEPEAAGIYALGSMLHIGLTLSDTFVVCAAGGGTVELVSYTITSLQPYPVISETAPGSGGLCGSSFINRIFSNYLENRLKGYRGWDEDYQDNAMLQFEQMVKPLFAGKDDRAYYIRVPGLPDSSRYGIKKSRLEISGTDLRKIFEPVIKEIQKLVLNQISVTREAGRGNVKAILLAGGFGQNECLKKSLEDVVDSDIQVRRVENSNTAVVRGALIRGLAGKDPRLPDWRIDSRIARRNFGICCYEAFDPSKHDSEKREVDLRTGGSRVKIMRWFVKRGTSIKQAHPKSFGFYYDQSVSEGHPNSMELEIFVCEDIEAPMYKTESVKELMKLKADFSTIPEEQLHRERASGGQEFYKLDFDIEMVMHSASLTFSLIYQGVKYNTVDMEFI